ncbi:Plastin-2 [Chionoecetes opilio]|uniref:Plastin-2 n=1 Tax=Chionoecetes opilio TaxID=41210 RepID=A0A8J4YDQ7_CHIOP|nr:Plastin-2 [Chionoecetes opilio]
MEILGMDRWDSFVEFLDDIKDDYYYKQIDRDGNGFIDLSELKKALDVVGFKLPQWEVRKMISDWDRDTKGPGKGQLSFEEFQNMCAGLKAQDVASTFKKMVNKRENLETLGGMSTASSEGTTHSVRLEEQLAFSDWINSNLGHDPDLKHLLPIDGEGKYLYDRVKDGILLCKVINHSCPDTIDERAINKRNLTVYTKHENLTLALSSAQAIGCNVVNIDAHDLAKGESDIIIIIRIGLFNQITLEHCPGLAHLLLDGEKIEELMKLSPEAILLRWVNHHLERAGVNRQVCFSFGTGPVRCNNFMNDIKDSEIYTYLLKQIAPNDSGVTMEALSEHDVMQRAELMLQQAEKLGCRSFLTPQDVVEGVYKLNVAFVANLFNN